MEDPSQIIVSRFHNLCETPSDINEHLRAIYELARSGTSAAELGVRGIVSTYALLLGLGQSVVAAADQRRSLTCVDIDNIDMSEVTQLGRAVGVDIEFICQDSAKVELPEVDLLWIDTWHIYEHLKRELNAHHKKVRRYIAMHDTEIDGVDGESLRCSMDPERQAKETGYPIEGICKGLKPAIDEFLAEHKDEWRLLQHYPNCNGMTVLVRVTN
jgi:hypothetical protein